MNLLFAICSVITLVVLAIEIIGLYLYPMSEMRLPETHGVLALFVLVLLSVAICLASQLWLWIGMLIFCMRYDRRPAVWRVLGVLFQICTLSFASCLIYFFAYRAQAKASWAT